MPATDSAHDHHHRHPYSTVDRHMDDPTIQNQPSHTINDEHGRLLETNYRPITEIDSIELTVMKNVSVERPLTCDQLVQDCEDYLNKMEQATRVES